MFDSLALTRFFEANSEIPHISRYHREGYSQHCYLVIASMLERTKNRALVIAAALHDIAKPRTQSYNKINEPCFYGHNEVNDDDLGPFISVDDSDYIYIKALIICHLIPSIVKNAKDFSKSLRKECRKALRKAGFNEEFAESDQFIADVIVLHECDDAGTIRHDEDLIGISEKIEYAKENIKKIN